MCSIVVRCPYLSILIRISKTQTEPKSHSTVCVFSLLSNCCLAYDVLLWLNERRCHFVYKCVVISCDVCSRPHAQRLKSGYCFPAVGRPSVVYYDDMETDSYPSLSNDVSRHWGDIVAQMSFSPLHKSCENDVHWTSVYGFFSEVGPISQCSHIFKVKSHCQRSRWHWNIQIYSL